MDDNCREWVECMRVASGCGEQEVGVASGCGCKAQLSSILLTCAKLKVWMTIVESGWNVWVWLVGVVSRRWVWLVDVVVSRYVDFLLLIPTPLVSVLFCSSILLFVHLKNVFRIYFRPYVLHKCSKCFYVYLYKYPPNVIFRNANINAQHANVTGSMN